MKLQVPTLEQCQRVREWRNQTLESLRTPYLLTEEMQEKFYRDVICNPNSSHRYWSIIETGAINGVGFSDPFVGFGGITNLQWENSIGEISLIISPEYRKIGVGEKAVDLLLDKAFNYLNLQTVCGECYCCNPAEKFWEKTTRKHSGILLYLPNRKYWDGQYWDSLYFSIDRKNYVK